MPVNEATHALWQYLNDHGFSATETQLKKIVSLSENVLLASMEESFNQNIKDDTSIEDES